MGARNFAYSDYNQYKPGGAWFICDRCSQRFRRSKMLVEWDNLRVDAACLDPRPPQMSVPDVFPEGLPFPDARSPQDRPDRLEDDTALWSVGGGLSVQIGQSYPNGQNQQPGALSPLPFVESPTPVGVNVLADDVTFITGPVSAPTNTDSTTPDPVPEPSP